METVFLIISLPLFLIGYVLMLIVAGCFVAPAVGWFPILTAGAA